MKVLVVIFFLCAFHTAHSQSLYQYYVSKASDHIVNREHEKATYFLNKAIGRYPDSCELFIIRAYNNHYLELADSSIADLIRARELGSENPYIPRFLGLNYEEKGDYEEAEANYLEFLKNVPEDTSIQITLINVLTAQDKFKQAEKRIKKFESENPNSHAPLMLRGLISHKREKYSEAIDYFTEYIEVSGGKDQTAFFHRSETYKELGMLTEMCEDIWIIRYSYEFSGSTLYFNEGCEKILNRQNLPPPEEHIIEVER